MKGSSVTDLTHYTPPDAARWTGRVDDLDDRDAFRWHQVIEVSPRFDSDDNTAKLAAVFIFALVDTFGTDSRGGALQL